MRSQLAGDSTHLTQCGLAPDKITLSTIVSTRLITNSRPARLALGSR